MPYLAGVGDAGGVLAPAAYHFAGAAVAGRRYAIYDYALKNELSDAVTVEVPARLEPHQAEQLARYTATVVEALGIRDLGRVDFRLREDGEITFIEVNALPSLEPGASLYESAALAGLETVDAVLDHLVCSAALRQGRTPRARSFPNRLRIGLTFNLKRIDPRAGDDTEAEFDSASTVGAISAALERLGHDVVQLEATAELMSILPGTDVDLVFNVAEGIGGRTREAQVPAMLELLGVEYTGSDAATMAITLDKALAKRIVGQAGVPTPQYMLMRTGDEPLSPTLVFPAVVKPNAEGSSKGVLPTSVVHNEDQLRLLARELCNRYRQPVLVESYLSGREFTVGLLGEHEPRALPAMEVIFGESAGVFPVYTFAHKLEVGEAVHYQAPAQVDDALAAELARVACVAWEALGCRDVARVDLRLDAAGRVNFIECNPLPGLAADWSDLCLIATGVGMDYTSLIGEIVAPAMRRLRATRSEGRR